MQECSAFVGDLDAEKFIRGVPRLYPDVRLTVRVMSADDRNQWRDRVRDKSTKDVTTRDMADRIASWDLPEPPNAETCAKLTPRLYDRIFSIIWGEDGGDADGG